jgi:hypothetical protein
LPFLLLHFRRLLIFHTYRGDIVMHALPFSFLLHFHFLPSSFHYIRT